MSQEELDNEISNRVSQLSGSHNMAEQVSYMIFGAAVTTTRAFRKVVIKVEPELNRVFVSVRLRWPFQGKRFKPLQDAWLKRAEKRCKEHCPTGWRMLIYYTQGDSE